MMKNANRHHFQYGDVAILINLIKLRYAVHLLYFKGKHNWLHNGTKKAKKTSLRNKKKGKAIYRDSLNARRSYDMMQAWNDHILYCYSKIKTTQETKQMIHLPRLTAQRDNKSLYDVLF